MGNYDQNSVVWFDLLREILSKKSNWLRILSNFVSSDLIIHDLNRKIFDGSSQSEHRFKHP